MICHAFLQSREKLATDKYIVIDESNTTTIAARTKTDEATSPNQRSTTDEQVVIKQIPMGKEDMVIITAMTAATVQDPKVRQ